MAIDYIIDPELRFVRITASGNVTGADILTHQRKLATDPAFNPMYSELFDGTQAAQVDVSDSDTRQHALHSAFGSGSRRAFVVQRMFLKGLLRRFQIYRELSGATDEIEVFSEMNEALAWLGLPAALSEPHQPVALGKAVGHFG